jgi:hypothetical protein
MRIELTQPAWKAGVLPLNYTRVKGVFTFLGLIFKRFFVVEGEGFEPSKTEVSGFTARPI